MGAVETSEAWALFLNDSFLALREDMIKTSTHPIYMICKDTDEASQILDTISTSKAS